MTDDNLQSPSDVRLTEEQVREVGRIQKKVRDGTAQFASDEQMAVFWKKCGCDV